MGRADDVAPFLGGYVKPLETYLGEVLRRAWVDDLVSRIAMTILLLGTILYCFFADPTLRVLGVMFPVMIGTTYYNWSWAVRRRENSTLTRRLMTVLMRDEASIDFLIGSGLESRSASFRRELYLTLAEPAIWAVLIFQPFIFFTASNHLT